LDDELESQLDAERGAGLDVLGADFDDVSEDLPTVGVDPL